MVFQKLIKMEFFYDQLFWDWNCPNDISKYLAKMAPPPTLLVTTSDSRIKNSGNLLNKINNKTLENKSLASLDIISLYSNIPVKVSNV